MDAAVHGHSHGSAKHEITITSNMTNHYEPAYFTHKEHTTVLTAHIAIMILTWVFILPIVVMLNLTRSRYSLPAQLAFLVSNAAGLIFATIYNASTPDLYENNAHHRFGWLLTCIVSVHVLLSYIPVHAAKKPAQPSLDETDYRRIGELRSAEYYRYSRDAEAVSLNESLPSSPRRVDSDISEGYEPAEPSAEDEEKQSLMGTSAVGRFFTQGFLAAAIDSTRRIVGITCDVINRVVLILGFVALATGFVTYYGYFKGHGIFSGLAHFVKGGIFFWYGLLVLGRCMGSFADLGWSWNLKPDVAVVGHRKAAAPSAEFVESFLIFFYGSTNIFLEHLGNWGKEWTASDLEHISITVLFFGGGLCGMLIESPRIRELLNIGVTSAASANGFGMASNAWQAPKTYGFSLNPLPGIVIMLLGLMMSSHHQESMVSTMLHTQWGTLFVAAALARAVTYILVYLSPPTSYLPSRPPSELVVAFCLISGGLLFMGSARDVVDSMERFDLNAMFLFTVIMGMTSFLMAWEIIVLALKGWALRREHARSMSSS